MSLPWGRTRTRSSPLSLALWSRCFPWLPFIMNRKGWQSVLMMVPSPSMICEPLPSGRSSRVMSGTSPAWDLIPRGTFSLAIRLSIAPSSCGRWETQGSSQPLWAELARAQIRSLWSLSKREILMLGVKMLPLCSSRNSIGQTPGLMPIRISPKIILRQAITAVGIQARGLIAVMWSS